MKTLKDLNALWDNFGLVSVDTNDCIESDWEIFEKGTHRETIWHWFESQNNKFSVAKHLYGG